LAALSGLAVPPLFFCLWSTGPRGRVCHPRAHSSASKSSRTRWKPDAPARAPVACPHRTSVTARSGSRQPEQYASDRGLDPNPRSSRRAGARRAQSRPSAYPGPAVGVV